MSSSFHFFLKPHMLKVFFFSYPPYHLIDYLCICKLFQSWFDDLIIDYSHRFVLGITDKQVESQWVYQSDGSPVIWFSWATYSSWPKTGNGHCVSVLRHAEDTYPSHRTQDWTNFVCESSTYIQARPKSLICQKDKGELCLINIGNTILSFKLLWLISTSKIYIKLWVRYILMFSHREKKFFPVLPKLNNFVSDSVCVFCPQQTSV